MDFKGNTHFLCEEIMVLGQLLNNTIIFKSLKKHKCENRSWFISAFITETRREVLHMFTIYFIDLYV